MMPHVTIVAERQEIAGIILLRAFVHVVNMESLYVRLTLLRATDDATMLVSKQNQRTHFQKPLRPARTRLEM